MGLGDGEATRSELTFVEEVAVAFEHGGLPRMAGRIIGWLLICDPPEQTSDQLAGVLQASKGSISSSTRLLVPSGLVERMSRPGERRDYFRLREEAWAELVRDRLAQVTSFRELTERGLTLLADDAPQRRARLEGISTFYAWLDVQLAALWSAWDEQRLLTDPNRNGHGP